MNKLIRNVALVFILQLLACRPSPSVVQEEPKVNYDSLRKIDSIERSLDYSSIIIEDEYYKKLVDTTFNSIKLQIQQNRDELTFYLYYLADTLNGDSIAKNYYYLQVDLLKNKKQLKRHFYSMLSYYNYYDSYYYSNHGKLEWEKAINKYSKSKEMTLPIWHLQNDTLPTFDMTINFKLFVIDSLTYKKTDNLYRLGKKLGKPICTFNKTIQLKNYTYYIKKLVLDSVYLCDKVFDVGLYGKPDLFYTLYTPFNSTTSSTDEQFYFGKPDIRKMYVFLQQPKGEMILYLKDEDVMYHDFLEGVRFKYGSNDSSYAFKFDSTLYNINIKRLYFSLFSN